MFSEGKKISMNKKIKKIAAFFLISVSNIYAQTQMENTEETIKKILGTILSFFSSAYIDVLCLVGLVIAGLNFLKSNGSPEGKRKLVIWLIAILLITSISSITLKLFEIQANLQSLTTLSIFKNSDSPFKIK